MIDNSHSPDRILESRLGLVKEAAKNYQITNLSLGLFSTIERSTSDKRTRGRKQLTVLGEADIVVSLVMPVTADKTNQSKKVPTVVYVKSLLSSGVSADVISDITTDVRRSLAEHDERIKRMSQQNCDPH